MRPDNRPIISSDKTDQRGYWGAPSAMFAFMAAEATL